MQGETKSQLEVHVGIVQRGGTTIAKIEREETSKKLARLFRVILRSQVFL